MAEPKEKIIRATYKGRVLEITTDEKPQKALEQMLFLIIREYYKKYPAKCEWAIEWINVQYALVKSKDKPRKIEELDEIENGESFFRQLMQQPPGWL